MRTQTSPSQAGTHVTVTYGKEGPAYDPYGYTEITVYRPGRPGVCLHTGLAVWVSVGGRRLDGLDEDAAIARFTGITGAAPNKWEAWHARARQACPQCGGRALREVGGYHGETAHICRKCGEIAYTDIDYGAIM